jgi:oxygen-independent coproporphyrinogen III oxidase
VQVFPDVSAAQVERLDRAAPRYTSYPTVPVWTEAFGAGDYGRALERASEAAGDPLSIYVHIPFCREMCTFCGCNAIVSRSTERADRYLDAVRREIGLVADRLGARRAVTRVHLGGGTPTTLDERQLLALWQSLTDRFEIRRDAEVAIEIDPAVTSTEQLALLRGLGFNRVSMGVQDFDPCVQQAVNRIQTAVETHRLVDYARKVGYRSVSLDLICGLPRQTPAGWAATLDQVIAMAPDRLAVFSFAYVPDVKPHQRRLPVADLPTGPSKLALQRVAFDRLVGAGYHSIGLDHFARPDDELAVADRAGQLWRDFQGYTTLLAPDTLALGITGIGNIGGAYVQSVRPLKAYYTAVENARLPVARGHWLSDDDRVRREVITAIMCNREIDLGAHAPAFAAELAALASGDAVADGLVEVDGARLRLTELGTMFRRNVAMVFDAYLRRTDEARAARPVFSRTV